MTNKAEIKVKGAQIKMEAARTKVLKFLADVDAFKAHIDASLRKVQYSTQVHQARTRAGARRRMRWLAMARCSALRRHEHPDQHRLRADADQRVHRPHAERVAAGSDRVGGGQDLGQYTAQLAAGAMSAMHVSAGISGSGSASTSDSNSKSTSTTYNYQY